MLRREWEPVSVTNLIGFVIGFGVFLLALFRSEPGFMPTCCSTKQATRSLACSALGWNRMEERLGNWSFRYC